MFWQRTQGGKRLLVPEVIQSSEMDCGPATLKSLLEGHGIPVNYGRLREACQTSVDGTSIDTLEEVANQLGLAAEQIMIPRDFIFLSSINIFPMLAVVQRSLALHFVIGWNHFAGWVQVMDPGIGRRWTRRDELLDELYMHQMPIPAADWWEWARDGNLRDSLNERLDQLELDEGQRAELLDAAYERSWFGVAAMDASIRQVHSLVNAKGMDKGAESFTVIQSIWQAVMNDPSEATRLIPPALWFALPMPFEEDEEPLVMLRGAVLMTVDGLHDAETMKEESQGLPPELAMALEQDEDAAERIIWRAFLRDGLMGPAALISALLVSSLTILIEVILLQTVIRSGVLLEDQATARELGIGILIFMVLMLGLQYGISTLIQRIGTRLETRLRVDFLMKLPELSDRYFHSRLISDMVQRVHSLQELQQFPELAQQVLVVIFQLILTSIGLGLIAPQALPIAVFATIFSVGFILITSPFLMEFDLRLKTQAAALSRHFFDAMQGIIPLRTHSAERSLRRQYEGVLVEWIRSGLSYTQAQVMIDGISSVVLWLLTVVVMFTFLQGTEGEASNTLLVLYWTLNIPVLAQQLVDLVRQYPSVRNTIYRITEPLTTPEQAGFVVAPEGMEAPVSLQIKDEAMNLVFDHVDVVAGGNSILRDINVVVEAGEHIGVVGPSGAGKSSFVGLLLGWHVPVNGYVWVDGEVLGKNQLERLREKCAWIDPDVHLWNRSLLYNLQYGRNRTHRRDLANILEQSNLLGLIERLPEGLQTELGESGRLVSGGEGQRVRLGRAFMRDQIRLVILDEPFRGLDRPQRQELLATARETWKDQTLIAITHDVRETMQFNRILVIEDGQVVEDGNPKDLLQHDTRYSQLARADEAVNEGLWKQEFWRRWWLEEGRLSERS